MPFPRPAGKLSFWFQFPRFTCWKNVIMALPGRASPHSEDVRNLVFAASVGRSDCTEMATGSGGHVPISGRDEDHVDVFRLVDCRA
jgi:hypothetical protein